MKFSSAYSTATGSFWMCDSDCFLLAVKRNKRQKDSIIWNVSACNHAVAYHDEPVGVRV